MLKDTIEHTVMVSCNLDRVTKNIPQPDLRPPSLFGWQPAHDITSEDIYQFIWDTITWALVL